MLTWAEAYLPSFLIFSFKLLMYIVWFRRTSGVVIFYKAAKEGKTINLKTELKANTGKQLSAENSMRRTIA